MPKPKLEKSLITEYWPFTHMRAWNPRKYYLFFREFEKMEDKKYNDVSKLEIMNRLKRVGFYRPTRELTSEELLKKWDKYVSLIYYLGIGSTENGTFKVSEMCKYAIKSKNLKNFLKIQMKKFQFPHGSLKPSQIKELKTAKRRVVPFVMTLQVLIGLGEFSKKEMFLSKGEIIKIIERANSHSVINRIVKKILENRRNKISYDLSATPDKVIDSINRLFPFFSGTGLCEFDGKNDRKMVYFKNNQQFNEAKKYVEDGYRFYDFRSRKDWLEYYQKFPRILPKKVIDKLSKVKDEKEFLDLKEKIIKRTPKKKRIVVDTEILEELDKKSIGFHKKGKIKKRIKEKRRNIALHEAIKSERGYLCQFCNRPTFKDKDGKNFVQTHHIIEYNNEQEDGPDRKNNILVLCPNCHMMFHYSKLSDIKKYYEKLRKKGVIKFEQFLELKRDGDIERKQIEALLKKGVIKHVEFKILLETPK